MNTEVRLRGSHLDWVLYKCCYVQDGRTRAVVAAGDGRPPQLPCVLSSSVHVVLLASELLTVSRNEVWQSRGCNLHYNLMMHHT